MIGNNRKACYIAIGLVVLTALLTCDKVQLAYANIAAGIRKVYGATVMQRSAKVAISSFILWGIRTVALESASSSR